MVNEGVGMSKSTTCCLLVTCLYVVTLSSFGAGCGKSAGGDAAQGRKQSGSAAGEQHPAQPPTPVAVERAKIGSISSYYAATATLEAEKEAEILARVTGVIKVLRCEEGDEVRKGNVLLEIDNDEYRLRLAQAAANAASLRDKYGRLQEMWEQKLVSAEEYQNGMHELKSAEAEEELAKLSLSYTRVTAPFSGAIVRRMVDVGQNVSVGTSLFSISDFDTMLARVQVPSKEFKKLQPDQPVDLILDSNNAKLHGRITLISPIIDPTSGTIKLTIEIHDYPPGTRPGDFAEVRIVTETRPETVLVPKIAVFTDRGDQIVFVAADSTAERRVVETGFEDTENMEIVSGVAVGEGVIVRGQRSLKHGAPIRIMNDSQVGDATSPPKGAGD
jgi:membrane fusion protein (multidrug efflux system)